MKRIIFILVILFLSVACFAQENPAGVETVHYINGEDVSFIWENEETDVNGLPYPDGSIVTYDVYLYEYDVATWPETSEEIEILTQDIANLEYQGNTAVKEWDIDFAPLFNSVYYFAGVREVVDLEGLGTEIVYTDIAWSFDSVSTNPIQAFAYLKHTGVWVLNLPFSLQTVITQ